jgi:hypothetical protein
MPRHFGLKSRPGPSRRKKTNDLEGQQDMGGKQGGQAGVPKSPPRPAAKESDADVAPKRSGPDRNR